VYINVLFLAFLMSTVSKSSVKKHGSALSFCCYCEKL
jgi:hypothetical protein